MDSFGPRAPAKPGGEAGKPCEVAGGLGDWPKPKRPADIANALGVAVTTVWNWIHNGVCLGGRVVKLRARRVGWGWFIDREAWEQFERDCNPDYKPLPESPAKAVKRLAAGKKAAAELLGS